jgi:NitT/TauT family transport system ATP-binding protein
MAPLAVVRVEGVSKAYVRTAGHERKTLWALRDVTFEAHEGEFVTLIGPSGCGKSTLLSCMAGLISYDEGEILIDGARVEEPGPDRAFVFQRASLLPWRTVERNVSYGLELLRETSAEERRQRVARAIEMVGLTAFRHHFPHELSGGMQQRVNLARALATHPRLLLMDEPFGALDALTKQTLQDELARLVGESSRITIFVTHDIEEAVLLGDRVLVMSSGPGRIAHVVEVPYPRPRARELTEEPGFQALVREVRLLLRAPVAQGA